MEQIPQTAESINKLKSLQEECYEVVANKNGTVPEKMTMENLPEAIASIHDTLEELVITENGTYTPQDGVDGFSKVVAEFDTSSLPKVTVDSFKVTNACINDEGRWEGEQLIDTSAVYSLYATFISNTKIKHLDASNWDTRNVTNMSSMFSRCSQIKSIDLSGWNTTNVTNMSSMFTSCYALSQLDVSNLDTSNVTNMQSLFHDCVSLKNLDVSKWDVSKVTNMNGMFRSIHLIEFLDLTKWDASKVTNNNYMFYDQGSKGHTSFNYRR